MDIVCLKIRPLRLRAFFHKELRMANFKDLAKKYFFSFSFACADVFGISQGGGGAAESTCR